MRLKLTRRRALELGLLTCKCGNPPNNYFDKAEPCAHCKCKEYCERGIHGVYIEAESEER